MEGRFLGAFAALVLGMASMPAHAYITFDAVVPDSPVAGETLSARISSGICDYILHVDGYPQITQTGNAVRMLIETASYDDPILCNSEPGSLDMPFGAFPPGTYTLQLDRHYFGLSGANIIETVGTRTFVVSGTPPVPTALPTLSLGSLLVLGFGILALVTFALRCLGNDPRILGRLKNGRL
jgi:hypothetical protein